MAKFKSPNRWDSYPVEEAKKSNLRHRPIGIGVQGLADAFIMLRMPFDSEEAQALNREIFETIYFAAMTASMELAKTEGPYETYQGSLSPKEFFSMTCGMSHRALVGIGKD